MLVTLKEIQVVTSPCLIILTIINKLLTKVTSKPLNKGILYKIGVVKLKNKR